MKKHLLSLLVLLMTTLSTHAYDFQFGDLYYNITGENTVEVTYQAWEMGYSGLTTATIPSTVTYNETTYSVTAIGDAAFGSSTSLTSVFIPESVTSIGWYAFAWCSALTSINIPETVKNIGEGAFSDTPWYNNKPDGVVYINSLLYGYKGTMPENTSIIIEDGTTDICSAVFYNKKNLISITIPQSVTCIGKDAFNYCNNLTKTNYTGDIADWCAIQFGSLNANPIYYSKNLYINDVLVTDLEIPSNVTAIGAYVLANCQSLSTVTIPNSVTSIGENAFYNILNIKYNGEATGSPWGAKCVNGSVDGYFVYTDETKKTLVGCNTAITGEISIPNSVTRIANNAFSDCSGITSVNIPDSISYIGNNVFKGCSSLTSVIWDAKQCAEISWNIGYYSYYGPFANIRSQITTFSIGEDVESIPAYLCYGMTNLSSITIPISVTSIGQNVFKDCSSLTSVIWNAKQCAATTWNYYNYGPFADIKSQITSFTIGDEVESIPAYLCYMMSNLIGPITIPNSVTMIGEDAFHGCHSLLSITIPNSATITGSLTFYEVCNIVYNGQSTYRAPWGARSMNGYVDGTFVYKDSTKTTLLACSAVATDEMIIPNSVTSIGNYAFRYCSNLTSITINDSVTSIGISAFARCSNLTSVIWNAKQCAAIDWKDYYEGHVYGPFADIKSQITSFVIGEKVESIPDYLCYGMSNLTSITIPDSVISIGEQAFRDCSSLTAITIPESVTTIGSSAFAYCSKLTKTNYTSDIADWCAIQFASLYANPIYYSQNLYINDVLVTDLEIPSNVTTIGAYAFANCQSLSTVTIPNSVTSIGEDAFYNILNIMYSGEASGSPWGAKCVNGYVDGFLVYESAAKTKVITCSNEATGDIIIPNSVTSIEEHAFYGSNITSITIPTSVTNIGKYAFSDCSNLTKTNYTGDIAGWCAIQFDNSVANPIYFSKNLYINDVLVTDLVIPDGVTGIGDYAFYNCSALTSVSVPESVTNIGTYAFYGCSKLAKTNYTGDIAGWCAIQFTSSSANPISYSKNLYINDVLATDLVIPDGVTNIGNYVFTGCKSLDSVTILESVTSIGESAFSGCSNLTSITIPNSVTSIGSSAFKDCSSLTSITIPESVTSIGEYVFNGCSALTSVIWNAKKCEPTIYGGYYYEKYGPFSNICSKITSFTIGEEVESIPAYLCYGMNNLSSITIPTSVTSIGEEVFYGCSSLTSVIWNAKQCAATSWETGSSYNKTYYYGPFANIKSQITSFTIGKEVENVPSYLCYGMSSLDSVTALSCTPPSCGSNVFYYTPDEKTLIVPSNSLESYKSTYLWKNFTSFEKCLSVFVQSSDSTLGVAQIDQDVDCDSLAIISATATPGYQFIQWSDGNTDNPRTIKLTQDTTLTAEFIFPLSGKCGDDLYWAYSNKEVKITGTGAMYNYTDSTMPWTLLRDSIKTVRVGNNATSIGEYAFANTPKLAELYIGANVEDIGANAFAGCTRLYDIYCYPIEPPFAQSNSFANYNVYVYVPCENQRDYTLDLVWGEFKFVECIGSEDVVVTDDEVVVAPSYEDVTITWPVVSGADTYSLVLTKEGDTFCTLVFNAQGQLVSIAFKPRRQNAPAEDGTTPATYAEQTANGFRFTVTGLDEGTDYAYTLTVRNVANSVLETYTGEFTTLSNTPTGLSDRPDTTETVSDKGAEKLLRDGQVLILRNGETYDMMGQRL